MNQTVFFFKIFIWKSIRAQLSPNLLVLSFVWMAQTHSSCWSCPTTTAPLQSLLLHQQSSLSLSLSIPSLCFPLCVRFTLPPCLSASECPGLLPVCFIKPVRDEVKSWHQLPAPGWHFLSVRSLWQAAGRSTVRGSSNEEQRESFIVLGDARWIFVPRSQ